MKRILLILLAVPCLFCSKPVLAALNTSFTYCIFNTPDHKPYVETYLSILGRSAEYRLNEMGLFQAKIEVTIVIADGDRVVNFKKYVLSGPELGDTADGVVNFLDQQRLSVPNGRYSLTIKVKDAYANDEPLEATQEIDVDFPEGEMRFSDIQLLERYKKSSGDNALSKSGYDLVPYVSSFFPDNLNMISYYAELYNSMVLGNDEDFLIDQYIAGYETGKIVKNLRHFSKEKSASVRVCLGRFDISKLPSGNYFLILEAHDKTNKILCTKKLFFQRSNPKLQLSEEDLNEVVVSNSFAASMTEDTLRECIRTLRPIATEPEKLFIDTKQQVADLELLRKFFLKFWQERNPEDPAKAWREYRQKVLDAEQAFATRIKHGYETDRGRVYLRYGKPNQRTEQYNEPSSYPYEVWQYYKTDVQSDARFVFYNEDLVTNDFELLHSNVIGEIHNYRWQYFLQRRNTTNSNLDDPAGDQQIHWGGRSEDFFNNPH